jgi:hypothetical protein
MDRRADPGNKLNEVYASCSTNGGSTWFDQRLTDSGPQNCVDFGGFPVPSGPEAGKSRFIGDYNGLDATMAAPRPSLPPGWTAVTARLHPPVRRLWVMFFFKR